MKDLFCLIGTVLISVSLFSNSFGEEKKEYEAWLVKEIVNSNLIIKACCKNNTAEETKIILKITAEKKGKAGTSRSIQSNVVLLKAKEKKCDSQIVFNLLEYDNYNIILEAYKDNNLIARDFIVKGNKSD